MPYLLVASKSRERARRKAKRAKHAYELNKQRRIQTNALFNICSAIGLAVVLMVSSHQSSSRQMIFSFRN